MKKKVAVVGAGFSGAVISHQLALAGFSVEVFDTRPHLAGNCHTERDAGSGVMVHVYGPHIFHTSNETVWNYIRQFDEFLPFTNRVKAVTGSRVFSLPVNLLTINQFFGKTFNPSEAREFVHSLGVQIPNPTTFEEQALRFVGRELYEAFFRDYTIKQWGTKPSNLPASILKRLPIRFNYDDNYYASSFQGMPRHGYTQIIEKMLDHKNICVHLMHRFERSNSGEFDHVFYSGPIDGWFGFDEGRLGYRTLDFVPERHAGDYQGNAVVNYCDLSAPWTRISEHKHFAPWESHDNTIIFKEYSRTCEEKDTPYYPVRLINEKALLELYVRRAWQESAVTFVGRLGTYRYLDMHVTIGEGLDVARKFISTGDISTFPPFNVDPMQ